MNALLTTAEPRSHANKDRLQFASYFMRTKSIPLKTKSPAIAGRAFLHNFDCG
jgi:hypothetical protein